MLSFAERMDATVKRLLSSDKARAIDIHVPANKITDPVTGLTTQDEPEILNTHGAELPATQKVLDEFGVKEFDNDLFFSLTSEVEPKAFHKIIYSDGTLLEIKKIIRMVVANTVVAYKIHCKR